jgi:hypothetical protein
LWPEWTGTLLNNRETVTGLICLHQNLPEDQCLFVRGFRVTRFLGILPPRLRGAAEPIWPPDRDDDDDNDDAKFDKQVISIPPETNVRRSIHLP